MRFNRSCFLLILLLIPILFCLGCGNGAKYPVFGPTIDMINGNWKLDRAYIDGIINDAFEYTSFVVFNGDGTGNFTSYQVIPQTSSFTWTATNDSITFNYDDHDFTLCAGYTVDWTELELQVLMPESTPENPYGTGQYITARNIYIRQD